jgi:hypothetical protein
VNGLNLIILAVALCVAGWILYANLWRAVLCLAPQSMKIEAEAPADKMKLPSELAKYQADLLALGFCAIGSRYEKPRFTHETISYDYAQEKEKAFATIYLGRDDRPRLYFLSHTDGGAFVISSNYRRPAKEIPGRYFSGALEDFATDRLFKAHLRRVASFGQPTGRFDQEGRLAAARAWFAGPGRAEVRLQNLHGLLWSVGTLGMVGAAIFGKR